MRGSSHNIQLKLTVLFTLFFISISGLAYYFLFKNAEKDTANTFHLKAGVFINYFDTKPEVFWDIDANDKKFLTKLLSLSNAEYLVIENSSGAITNSINLEKAESHIYLRTDIPEELTADQNILRYVLPVFVNQTNIGKAYIGFNSIAEAKNLHTKKLWILLFCSAFLLVGVIYAYLVNYLSFRPLARVFKKLDQAVKTKINSRDISAKQDELVSLADRINVILNELDKSSSQVDHLNKKVQEFIQSKLRELSQETSYRKQAEFSLIKSEEQFKILFENAPIGMVILSPDNKIVSLNKSFCRMAGYEPEELLNMPIRCLIDKDRTEFFKGLDHDNESFNVIDLTSEKLLVRRSGTEINVIVKAVPVLDSEKQVKHYIIQVMDISQIKSIQKELMATLEKAKESDRLKTAFLAQMSHEIRTPLNVILTSIPLLSDEIQEGDEDTIIILDSVKSAGKRLQRTIDMILNMSSVQSGNYKADFEYFDIGLELGAMTSELKSLGGEKGLKVIFNSESSDSIVFADKYTVNQIFQNIINNAIKYTPQGYVKVSIRELDVSQLEIEVKDSGIGMSEEYMKNMFTPFSQEDAGHKRQYEGNGLGLALVKKYIELNHADIIVKSEKNIGSSFIITFDKSLTFEKINKPFQQAVK